MCFSVRVKHLDNRITGNPGTRGRLGGIVPLSDTVVWSSLTPLGLQSRFGDNLGQNYLEFDRCVPKTGLEF